MQSVQGIMGRIHEIQERTSSPPLPGRFQALLDSHLGAPQPGPSASPSSGSAPSSAPGDALAGTLLSMSTATLGTMLGSSRTGATHQSPVAPMGSSHVSSYLDIHGISSRNGRLGDAELVPVSGGWNGRQARLLPPAAAAWEAMRSAASQHGVDLYAIDTYRSWEVQDRAHQAHLRGEKTANVLPAGHSQHGFGLAVDLTNGALIGPGDEEWQWMEQYGRQFGWHPISNESWHWEFRGLP